MLWQTSFKDISMKPSNLGAFSELGQYDLDRASILLLPEAYCRQNQVCILGRLDPNDAEPATVGMLKPTDAKIIADIERRLARRVSPVRLNRYEIEKVLRTGSGDTTERGIILEHRSEPKDDRNVTELLHHMLGDAVARRASDIHIESYADDVDVRYRIDGIMHQVFTHLNPSNASEVISKLKVLCELDITEKRRPQDGRFGATVLLGLERKDVDFRVNVIPAPHGLDCVIRVLDGSVGLIPVAALGMSAPMQHVFLRLLRNPEGLVLVTGPTGCGKTTTLYAAIRQINDGRRKIVTAENPIEYDLPKVAQKRSTPKMSLEQLSRALLRHDPDVLLFGEVRDKEMGEVALRASLTGHMVLSTLHTDDAVGAIVRMRAMGLDEDDIAASLLGVLAQRLVRKICDHCKEPTLPSDQQAGMLGVLVDGIHFFEGRGCDRCNHTGYRGRIGVFELLLVDEGLQDLIAEDQHKTVLRRYVVGNGFSTMVDDVLAKVNAGLTTVDEVARVLPFRQLAIARQARTEAAKETARAAAASE
jgi:general secretion pathway protein E